MSWQLVTLRGGPFDGQQRRVWKLTNLVTVPISYRRLDDHTFIQCDTPTVIEDDSWQGNRLPERRPE